MKALVDNQLPEALAIFLRSLDVDCIHVRELGLDIATDGAIRRFAAESGNAIISKDSDFVEPDIHFIQVEKASSNELKLVT